MNQTAQTTVMYAKTLVVSPQQLLHSMVQIQRMEGVLSLALLLWLEPVTMEILALLTVVTQQLAAQPKTSLVLIPTPLALNTFARTVFSQE
jgi:hypothetical protein